ncbi:hypothetical protein C8F04DRAFT_1256737 [Mycena alexandri]|uniref:Uncharacterized protein n=1 Tax=Mycena alexandri TaxID=1745969 RepID=A0AAD6T5S4_9AGAR|nr:hypothetical protein C8F04DRAFT_1256737 [Mycena alexandri]
MVAIQRRFTALLGLCLVASAIPAPAKDMHARRSSSVTASPQVPRLPRSMPNAPKPDTNAVPPMKIVRRATSPPSVSPAVPDSKALVPDTPKRTTPAPPAVPDPKAETKALPVSNTPRRAMSAPPSVPVPAAAPSMPRELPAAPEVTKPDANAEPSKKILPDEEASTPDPMEGKVVPAPKIPKRATPTPPAAPTVPDPKPEIPVPDPGKRSTPAPATPAVPNPEAETNALPKRDVTDPDQLEDDFSPEVNPLVARSTNSDSVPEPMEHPPIHRQQFSRDTAAPVTEPVDTIADAESGDTKGQQAGKTSSTDVMQPSAIQPLDENSDTPVLQTNQETTEDNDKTSDVAVAGPAKDASGQTLHDHSETRPDGENTTDMDAAGGMIQEHKQMQSERALPVDESHPTVTDHIVATPVDSEKVHEHTN